MKSLKIDEKAYNCVKTKKDEERYNYPSDIVREVKCPHLSRQ